MLPTDGRQHLAGVRRKPQRAAPRLELRRGEPGPPREHHMAKLNRRDAPAPQPIWRLCIPHVQRESKSLPQRFAVLSQRFAVRRAFGSPKSEKHLKISRHFSRQKYASDVRARQTFLTTSAQLAGDVQYPQQAPSCCIAFVLLGVRGIHPLCTIRSNLRQNYELIAAHLSDKSQTSFP